MTKNSVLHRAPHRLRRLLSAGLVAAFVLTGVGLAQASAAQAAGTPTGPKYTYRMVSVSQSQARYKSTAISGIMCNRTPNAGTTSYSTAATTSNTFSVTGDLSFSALAGLLAGKIAVSGGVTTSTTTTEALSINLDPNQCAQVFALRNAYTYTLQRRCNYACTSAEYGWGGNPNPYLNVGTGKYTKVVGRAFYLV